MNIETIPAPLLSPQQITKARHIFRQGLSLISKDKLFKEGIINKTQRDRTEKVSQKARKTNTIGVKSIAEGKKLANKLSKMFKVGGGSDFPIKVQQGPDVVVRREPVVKDKNKFNSGGIVNFKGVF